VLERDAENSYLAGDAVEGGPIDQLLGHSMMYTERTLLYQLVEDYYSALKAHLAARGITLPG